MPKLVFKISSVLVGFWVLFVVFFVGVSMLDESYNPFDPYADTEFAPRYSPEKFALVKVGMSRKEIEQLIGKPLFTFQDTLDNQVVVANCDYTNDGYLHRRTDKPYAWPSDLAWYRSTVTFNADNIVIGVDSGWSYD